MRAEAIGRSGRRWFACERPWPSSYFSGFTSPGAENDLHEVRFAILTKHEGGFSLIPVFVATTRFAHNGRVCANVPMHTGVVVNHGHFLTATILSGSDLVATQLYVYGYLAHA